ncbi:MAG TPA: hypothetical protein VK492_01805 [Chitinophagaceae bacterium]|nr:hypothetical protein [Chitinophagaceae bacterium]
MLRIITILLFSSISIASISQTDHSPQLSAWRSEFSKQEFVAANFNTIINFTLNANSIPCHEITILPTNCFKKKNKPKCN